MVTKYNPAHIERIVAIMINNDTVYHYINSYSIGDIEGCAYIIGIALKSRDTVKLGLIFAVHEYIKASLETTEE